MIYVCVACYYVLNPPPPLPSPAPPSLPLQDELQLGLKRKKWLAKPVVIFRKSACLVPSWNARNAKKRMTPYVCFCKLYCGTKASVGAAMMPAKSNT